jgi:hypothetical protein
MTDVVELPVVAWDEPLERSIQDRAIVALESGAVLFFPRLAFPLQDAERPLLAVATVANAKNVSFNPAKDAIAGTAAPARERQLLRNLMSRFAGRTHALLHELFPRYDGRIEQARTSYRPAEIAGRRTSWRKDDTRLHVDSFPSSPIRGRRILRVFSNVNPEGRARTWRIGEPFEAIAARFVPSIPDPVPGAFLALDLLGITKSRRSRYDHYMLRLHDRMKHDAAYQRGVEQRVFDFPAGTSWMVFTDEVSHAAVRGQYALEQTYLLPVDAMLDPSHSPLRVLERMTGRALA